MIKTTTQKEISLNPYAIVSKFDDEEKISLITQKQTIEECNEWLKTMTKNCRNDNKRCDMGKNKLRVHTNIGIINYWVISLNCVVE